jgi:hypothetical protein
MNNPPLEESASKPRTTVPCPKQTPALNIGDVLEVLERELST